MEQSELNALVNDVYQNTYQLWELVRPKLSAAHDHGFKILYGPPRLEPPVLVIGIQPGGNASHIKPNELREPSDKNEYLSKSWPMAAELRKRFGIDYLQGAVGTNMIFFRAPSWADWKKIERSIRLRLEAFCLAENKRLIHAMRPKQILMLGWDTLDLFGHSKFQELVANKAVSSRPRRKRLLQSGTIGGIPAFAIPHPTAAWKNPPVTDDDWDMIVSHIKAAL